MPTVTVPLMSVAPVTPRSRLLTLDLRRQSFEFKPGQAVLIGAPGIQPRRPYSLACSPEQSAEARSLELLIALEADGTLDLISRALLWADPLKSKGPLGTFCSRRTRHARLLFVAGGPDRATAGDDRPYIAPRSGPRISCSIAHAIAMSFAFIEELRGQRKRRTAGAPPDGNAGRQCGVGRQPRSHRTLALRSVVHYPSNTSALSCGPRAMVIMSYPRWRDSAYRRGPFGPRMDRSPCSPDLNYIPVT